LNGAWSSFIWNCVPVVRCNPEVFGFVHHAGSRRPSLSPTPLAGSALLAHDLLLGEPRVNVLELDLALDELAPDPAPAAPSVGTSTTAAAGK
jgi:hypothetical protein